MKKTLNYETGKLSTLLNNESINLSKERIYVFRYIDDLTDILSLPLGTKQLLVFLSLLIDEKGIISLNRETKNQIVRQLGITMGTIDNYLTILVQAGVFKRIGRGRLLANRHLFPQPEWNSVIKGNVNRDLGLKCQMKIAYLASGERQILFSIE